MYLSKIVRIVLLNHSDIALVFFLRHTTPLEEYDDIIFVYK